MKKTNLSLTRIILITICLCITSVTFAGNKKDMLKKAIERGPTPAGSYVIYESDGKPININYMIDYISRKTNFIIVSSKSEENGYPYHRLIQLEFIKNYDDYIGWLLYTLHGLKPNTPTKEGKAFRVIVPNRTGVFITYKEKDYNNQHFDGDILSFNWTGEVVDGFIHGTGVGYYFTDNGKQIVTIEGTYKHGFPASEMKSKFCYLENWTYKKRIISSEETLYKGSDSRMFARGVKKNGGTFDTQVSKFLAKDGAAENYIKEAKQLLKSGKTPVLSEDIIGRLGILDPTRFFAADEKSIQKRILFTHSGDDPKALEALYYLDLFDGLYLASADNAEKAKKYVSSPNTFEYMNNSNYRRIMKQAQKAVKELLNMNSTKDIRTELISAQKTIDKWGETIFAEFNKSLKKRNGALTEFWGSVVDDLKYSSGSSSSSSSSNDDRIERITLSDFKYEFDGNWGDGAMNSQNGRFVKFKDKNNDNYSGKLYRDGSGQLYISTLDGKYFYNNMENAIIALYVYTKYGKIRKTGHKSRI